MRGLPGGFVAVSMCAIGLSSLTLAQSAPPDSPAWAYGVPNSPPETAPGTPGAAGGQSAGGARQPDTSLKHIPESTQAFTLAQIRDFFNVADWFPDDHPPMPDVFVRGRAPDVRGCGMCHMPNGKGRPENAPIAGLPYVYVVQQLADFKNDLRTSADPRKTNTTQMIQAAKAMTVDEIKAAAAYLAAMPWTPWIRVVEADTVPAVRLSGNVFMPAPAGGTEPIGDRIIETPEDPVRFELLAELPRAAVVGHPAGQPQGDLVAAHAAGRGEADPGRHAQSGRLRGVAGPVGQRGSFDSARDGRSLRTLNSMVGPVPSEAEGPSRGGRVGRA